MEQEERIILLVEDNPDDELLTLRALEENNIRNKVVVAHDGVEALEYLFGEGQYEGRDLNIMPQVILLDIKLPRMDGLEPGVNDRARERAISPMSAIWRPSSPRLSAPAGTTSTSPTSRPSRAVAAETSRAVSATSSRASPARSAWRTRSRTTRHACSSTT